jgi:predicted DNA-binding transcriptional regulator AlpA
MTRPSELATTEERYINREQLREIIPACDMTLWRWERNPAVAFPPPVKLGDDWRNYWWLPSILAWARERAARQVARRASGRNARTNRAAASTEEEPDR